MHFGEVQTVCGMHKRSGQHNPPPPPPKYGALTFCQLWIQEPLPGYMELRHFVSSGLTKQTLENQPPPPPKKKNGTSGFCQFCNQEQKLEPSLPPPSENIGLRETSPPPKKNMGLRDFVSFGLWNKSWTPAPIPIPKFPLVKGLFRFWDW